MSNLQTILEDLAADYESVGYLHLVKSGKEATVHLVQIGSDLRALKIYRQNQKFSSRKDYLVLEQVADKRMIKAINKRSKTGISGMENIWVTREAQAMEGVFEAGGLVPQILKAGHGYLLMEYLGTIQTAAPRLSDIKLSKEEARVAIYDVCQSIYYLLELGYVHGDLSAYNVLWFKGRAYVIDFPQVLDLRTNRIAKDKLVADLNNLEDYFCTILQPSEVSEYTESLRLTRF